MQDNEPSSRARRRWTMRVSIVSLVAVFLAGGILFEGAHSAVEATNELQFCISCHEMRENNYAEYKDTIHARNRTGVKAVCSDCHVPHGFLPVAARKFAAVSDVYHHLVGTESTREQFEAHRLELAMKVWRHMKETDSAECRHCHDAASMDPSLQGPTARKQHQKIGINGKTCIDCHYGIAHNEPAGGLEPADAVSRKDD